MTNADSKAKFLNATLLFLMPYQIPIPKNCHVCSLRSLKLMLTNILEVTITEEGHIDYYYYLKLETVYS